MPQWPGASALRWGVAASVLAALFACGERASRDTTASASNTAVLGSPATAPQPEAPVLRDASGQATPPPPVPAGATAQAAFTAPDVAWAIWVQEGRTVGSRYTRATGWAAPIPFERIAGVDSDPQLASNGQGTALALWRHTVGRIESLRYSRWDPAGGWSGPDVLHGALPRARPGGLRPDLPHPATAPKLTMDGSGTAYAEWPSGFNATQVQTSMHLRQRGWTQPQDRALTAEAAPPSASESAGR